MTWLFSLLAACSLQAIDKYKFKGDVFKLGDLLADAGDNRLKNALKEFRDNQDKLVEAAGNLLKANDGLLLPIFDPASFPPHTPNNQQLMLGVAASGTLIKAANDYQVALDEYEAFVNKTYEGLSPPRSTPRTMTASFARCRDWADSSRILAENVQVYFKHRINGIIPVGSSKAKELVAFLEKRVRIDKEVVANQKIFDREKKKLEEAVAVLDGAKENHDKAKKENDGAVLDLAAQTKNLATGKSTATKTNERLFLVNKRFVTIEGLVESYATETAAKDALNKASLALNAATNAFVAATNAVIKTKANALKATSALTAANLDSTTATNVVNDAKNGTAKAQSAFTAADTAAKAAEATAKKIAGDANKTKEEKDAANKDADTAAKAANTAKIISDKAKATEQEALEAATAKAKAATNAQAADAKAKAAVVSAIKAVPVQAKAKEKAGKAVEAAKKKVDTANVELIKAQDKVSNLMSSRVTAEPVEGGPTQAPVPNTVNRPKVNGTSRDPKELWAKYRDIREQDLRGKYFGGDPKWRVKPGSAEDLMFKKEWQKMGQAKCETYLLSRGIILSPLQPKPFHPAPKQVKPPQRELANNQKPPILQEKDAKKELDSLKIEKVKAQLDFEKAIKQEIAAGKLLVNAMSTLKKVKPVFEAAQIKWKESKVKETRQRKQFDGAESKLDTSKSDLGEVKKKIKRNRISAWKSCVRDRDRLRDGYVKLKPELKNDSVPFTRD